MSEEKKESSISFRADRQADMLNLKKNKFGHTLSRNSEEQESSDKINLSFGNSGTGVVAHVDLFDSPHLKKFIENSDLELLDDSDDNIIEEIDLSESEVNIMERPNTLEEFDLIADSIIKPNNNQVNKSKFMPADSRNTKCCNQCDAEIKKDSKFCSNCGAPQLMAQFCKNCGNKFSSKENFCSECGTKRE